jgi:hypothetical protein
LVRLRGRTDDHAGRVSTPKAELAVRDGDGDAEDVSLDGVGVRSVALPTVDHELRHARAIAGVGPVSRGFDFGGLDGGSFATGFEISVAGDDEILAGRDSPEGIGAPEIGVFRASITGIFVLTRLCCEYWPGRSPPMPGGASTPGGAGA